MKIITEKLQELYTKMPTEPVSINELNQIYPEIPGIQFLVGKYYPPNIPILDEPKEVLLKYVLSEVYEKRRNCGKLSEQIMIELGARWNMKRGSTHVYVLHTLESACGWTKFEESPEKLAPRIKGETRRYTKQEIICNRMADYLKAITYDEADQSRIFDNLAILVPNTIRNGLAQKRQPPQINAITSLDSCCL